MCVQAMHQLWAEASYELRGGRCRVKRLDRS